MNNVKIKLCLLSFCFFISCGSEIKIAKFSKTSIENWTTFGGNNRRQNNSNSSFGLPTSFAWEYSTMGGISSFSASIADSNLYAGLLNGELQVINILTGKKIGGLILESPILTPPIIEKQILYIALSGRKNSLRAYDMMEANILWKTDIPGVESPFLLLGNNIFIGCSDGSVYCINKSKGNIIWKQQFPKPIHSGLASDSTKIIFGCDDGNLYALDKNNGKELWSFFAGESIFSTPVIYNNNVFFGSDNGYYYSIDIETGHSNWYKFFDSPIKGGSAVTDSNIYFATLTGKLFSLNMNNGNKIWEFSAKSVINTAPIICKNYVAFSSLDKKVYVLDRKYGIKNWEYEFEGRTSAQPLIWNNYLICFFEDYNIIAFKND